MKYNSRGAATDDERGTVVALVVEGFGIASSIDVNLSCKSVSSPMYCTFRATVFALAKGSKIALQIAMCRHIHSHATVGRNL